VTSPVHHVYGGRVHGDRDSAPEQPDPTHRLSPLVTVTGHVEASRLPDCETCPLAVRRMCMRSVINRGPFALDVCNLTPVKHWTLQATAGRKAYAGLIWQYCIMHNEFTVRDVAGGLRVKPDTIRYHFKRLLADGRLVAIGTVARGQRLVTLYTAAD
jgi:hypothetical protein